MVQKGSAAEGKCTRGVLPAAVMASVVSVLWVYVMNYATGVVWKSLFYPNIVTVKERKSLLRNTRVYDEWKTMPGLIIGICAEACIFLVRSYLLTRRGTSLCLPITVRCDW